MSVKEVIGVGVGFSASKSVLVMPVTARESLVADFWRTLTRSQTERTIAASSTHLTVASVLLCLLDIFVDL